MLVRCGWCERALARVPGRQGLRAAVPNLCPDCLGWRLRLAAPRSGLAAATTPPALESQRAALAALLGFFLVEPVDEELLRELVPKEPG